MAEGNISQKFRRKNIEETKNYFIKEIGKMKKGLYDSKYIEHSFF